MVPRFFLETALLRCYKFSCEHEGFPALVERLSLMARGIADPMVQSYARLYLTMTVQQVVPNNMEMIIKCARQNYEDFLTAFKYFCKYHTENADFDVFRPVIKFLVKSQFHGLQQSDPRRGLVVQ